VEREEEGKKDAGVKENAREKRGRRKTGTGASD